MTLANKIIIHTFDNGPDTFFIFDLPKHLNISDILRHLLQAVVHFHRKGVSVGNSRIATRSLYGV